MPRVKLPNAFRSKYRLMFQLAFTVTEFLFPEIWLVDSSLRRYVTKIEVLVVGIRFSRYCCVTT
jgi:hypothetical protein